MSSVFDKKIAAVRDKIPKSVLDSPWKRTLLLVAFLVFMVGAIFVFLFVAIFWLLKGVFTASGKSLNSSAFAEDDGTQAEMDETSYLHQHYKTNGTIVQGLKDPEW